MAKKHPDTQDMCPEYEVDLESVGVNELKALVRTRHGNREYRFLADISISMNLDRSKKGLHMSRLIESITEVFEAEAIRSHRLIEDLGKGVLLRLMKTHPYENGRISIKTQYVMYKKTPVSDKRSTETYDVGVTVRNIGGNFRKSVRVSAVGSTSCPHSMEYSGMPHIQRATGELEIEGPYDSNMNIDDMIDCVDRSFSSETYTLLKSADEKHVVEKMHKNPKFVEDVARAILANAGSLFEGCSIRSKAVSFESIHKHNVFAKGWIRGKL